MRSSKMLDRFQLAFDSPLITEGNFAVRAGASTHQRQQQTNSVFSDKWEKYDTSSEKERLYEFQRKWYLALYGFESEDALAVHLRACNVIFDAGCGLGYKAAWFAGDSRRNRLLSEWISPTQRDWAAVAYADLPNLYFVQGDIAATGIANGAVDYASCDQVIMHTEDPERTFSELARITEPVRGQVACYFYAKKALPRELLDDYFRAQCQTMDRQQLWEMAEQLTDLGRQLSALDVKITAPDIISGARHPRWYVRRSAFHLLEFSQVLLERGARSRNVCRDKFRLV